MKENNMMIGEGYETPEISVLEIRSEGVLCSSFEQYDEDTVEW